MDKLLSLLKRTLVAVPSVTLYLRGKARWLMAEPEPYKTYEYMLGQILRLISDVYNNNMQSEFIDLMGNLISGQLRQAFQQALEDQGYTDAFLPDYLSASYEIMVLEQYGFVDGFFADIVSTRELGKPVSALLARASAWANRWNEAYNEATRLITLDGGGNMVWREGDTKEKCNTCVSLDGIVASAKEWDLAGFKPQGSMLDCGGFNCQCSLEPTDQRRSPNAFGRLMNVVSG